MKIERDSGKSFPSNLVRSPITKAKNNVYRMIRAPVFIPEAGFISSEDKILYDLIIKSIIPRSFIHSPSSEIKGDIHEEMSYFRK